MKKEKAMALVNKDVIICGNHPYTGASGKVISINRIHRGYGLVIKLNHRKSAVDELFIYKAKHIKVMLKATWQKADEVNWSSHRKKLLGASK